ncbi:hypothetical protein LIA77_05320 [Sarocladium implicatum]|nr:hypothetical protein LIA77_05320 [Sarocladium implicatum]
MIWYSSYCGWMASSSCIDTGSCAYLKVPYYSEAVKAQLTLPYRLVAQVHSTNTPTSSTLRDRLSTWQVHHHIPRLPQLCLLVSGACISCTASIAPSAISWASDFYRRLLSTAPFPSVSGLHRIRTNISLTSTEASTCSSEWPLSMYDLRLSDW